MSHSFLYDLKMNDQQSLLWCYQTSNTQAGRGRGKKNKNTILTEASAVPFADGIAKRLYG